MSVVRALAFIAALVLVCAPAAGAAKKKPPTSGVHHTVAGGAAARRALLRASDLGSGWSKGATPKKIGKLTCGTAAPTLAGVLEIGSAITPTYRQSSSGPFLSQATYVYGSPAEAALFWQHISGPAALACLAKGVAGGSTKDVSFRVTHQQALPAPAGKQSAAYRVVGQAKTSLQKVAVYVDVVLVQRGNAISEISWSSFSAPVAARVEQGIARTAATRL
jgi:hypothetical protein